MSLTPEELDKLTIESETKTTPAAKADISRLPLFLVFSHNTAKIPNGGWDDYRGGHSNYAFAVMQMHAEFAKPTVTVVQIVNRFSGLIEMVKRK